MGQCYNTAVIHAPIDKVWATVRNFHDMGWASEVLSTCEAAGGIPPDQPGAKRILSGAFHETLKSIDDTSRSFSYNIDEGPPPLTKDAIKNYLGEVRLLPITENNTTFIEWKSTYQTNDDKAVGDFCNPIYQALLGALQKHLSS